ncbi:MAG: mechanosensitive ion channel family protein [Myxococcaceae bacterium]
MENLLHWLDQHPPLATSVGLIGLLLVAGIVFGIARRLVLPAMGDLTRRSPSSWGGLLFELKFFHRLSWAIPWLLLHQLTPYVPHLSEGTLSLLRRISVAGLVIVFLRAVGSLFSMINAIYVRYPSARSRPIKGFLQGILIAAWTAGVVLIVATVLDKSPLLLLSGLGAMTAVLLLVFRDTLLSLVAGIQLTTNDLVRVGDWIEMPQFGADGDVVDIGLHAVKVQNWDKTITVIPTHRFLEHSFKNWRGMTESGGRRIKRAFHIDMTSVRFIGSEEIDHFGRFALLQDYIARKKQELEVWNREHQEKDPNIVPHARLLTNVGTLRAWIVNYLRQHPKLHKDRVLLVRQLAPTPEGLPIEIYAFCNDTAWTTYENVQADIFDHVLAMVPRFGLRVFQNPSSYDLAAFGNDRVRPAAPVNELRKAAGSMFREET